MQDDDWHPSCSMAMLVQRADLLHSLREFFREQGVLEVETPVLSRGTGTDPALDAPTTRIGLDTFYLQTSPELHLKRLLAAGAPSIYRLGPVFRDEQTSAQHNPEFTMLEWYRLGWTLADLMDDVATLVDRVLGPDEYRQLTYCALLAGTFGVEPGVSRDRLLDALREQSIELSPELIRSGSERELLDLMFDVACRRLGGGRVFVTDYPADQAALARTACRDGHQVALRFELIIAGLEIANGYDELVDAVELERRAAVEIGERRGSGRPVVTLDARLLAAQRHGLPSCCGVALGVDRLLMLASGAEQIADVLSFSARDA